MKKTKQIVCLLSLFAATSIFSSCDRHFFTVLEIQNDTDATLYIELAGDNRASNTIYAHHGSCLFENQETQENLVDKISRNCFDNAIDEFNECVVKLNDKDVQTLKIWSKNDAKNSSGKEFFDKSSWTQQRNADTNIYTFVIRQEDLN